MSDESMTLLLWQTFSLATTSYSRAWSATLGLTVYKDGRPESSFFNMDPSRTARLYTSVSKMLNPSSERTITQIVGASRQFYSNGIPYNCTSALGAEAACVDAKVTVVWGTDGWEAYEASAEELGYSYGAEIPPQRLHDLVHEGDLFQNATVSKLSYSFNVLAVLPRDDGRSYELTVGF